MDNNIDGTIMNDITTTPNPDIAQPTTSGKRRGKKPSGIVKNNVCVRLTDEMKAYLMIKDYF